MATAATEDIPAKIVKFEAFVNEKLKTDLANVLKLDEEAAGDIENCIQLSVLLNQLKEKQFNPDGQAIKTLCDIGSNFYVQTVIDDPSSAIVYLGLGFYLQMTLEEALDFLSKRKSMLELKRKSFATAASKINANIRLVLEGLRELQGIQTTEG